MNASTPIAAMRVSGTSPEVPSSSHAAAHTPAITIITRVRRRPVMRLSTVNCSSTMTIVLTANGEADDRVETSATSRAICREARLHLPVADEHAMKVRRVSHSTAGRRRISR
jgi:hypothetical protein